MPRFIYGSNSSDRSEIHNRGHHIIRRYHLTFHRSHHDSLAFFVILSAHVILSKTIVKVKHLFLLFQSFRRIDAGSTFQPETFRGLFTHLVFQDLAGCVHGE